MNEAVGIPSRPQSPHASSGLKSLTIERKEGAVFYIHASGTR